MLRTQRQHFGGAASLALEAQAAVPSADVEHATARQIGGQLHRIAHLADGVVAGRENAVEYFPALVPIFDAVAEVLRAEALRRRRDRANVDGHDGSLRTNWAGNSGANYSRGALPVKSSSPHSAGRQQAGSPPGRKQPFHRSRGS